MTHPTDDSLKPCPFCGGAASLHPRTCDKNTPYNPADRAFPIARCGQCGAEAVGKDWGRPETAASAWNRRALLAAQPAGAWMPIPDSMPPLGEQVLVWCKFGPHWGPMVDCWDEQHEAPVSFSSATIPVGPGWDSGSEFEDVTHWMRIGAPEQAAAQPAVQQPAEDAGLLDRHGKLRGDLKASAYCVGNEYKPFHPSASHVRPEWRDGWNACFVAAIKAQGGKQ